MDKESAVVYNTKGKKLCEITPHQSWRSWIGIPLFPLPITMYENKVWKNPDEIIRWAWHGAVYFSIACQTKGIKRLSEVDKRRVEIKCLICGNASVIPHVRWTIWGKRMDGVMCSNKDCPMFKVIIPLQMLTTLSLDDIPVEYRPNLVEN